MHTTIFVMRREHGKFDVFNQIPQLGSRFGVVFHTNTSFSVTTLIHEPQLYDAALTLCIGRRPFFRSGELTGSM